MTDMADIDKVMDGLRIHAEGCGYRGRYCDSQNCPYRYGDESCDIEEMCRDAYVLLKKYKEHIELHKCLVDTCDKMYLELKERKRVVLCKDCKHHLEHNCPIWTDGVYDPLWFCKDGVVIE